VIVRRLAEVHGSRRHVTAPTWESHRLLVAHDDLGFSLHHTVIKGGTETEMQYRNHLEAVYCVGGSGSLTDLATGERHRISPGTVYALDRHDPHILQATTDLHMVCVFTPACVGDEQHDATGSYPLATAGDP
jgi:L-ectoine synthase